MSVRSKESGSESRSIASCSMLADTTQYNVDLHKLYESILKILILEYRNEARFRTPIIEPRTSSSMNSTSSTSSSSNSVGYSKYYRNSSILDEASEPQLPSYLLSSLEHKLNLIAMKKEGTSFDEMTRRSLLRLYSELLDPKFKADVARVNKSEYLVMKFVSSANKEMIKLGRFPSNQISDIIFEQAGTFVQILIGLIRKDKDSDAIIAKLKDEKESLKPNKQKSQLVSGSSKVLDADTAMYLQPSFRVTDMDQAMISLIVELFSVDHIKLQHDIFKQKDIASEKALHKDIQQILFYLEKGLGQFTSKSFANMESYEAWKKRELSVCEYLKQKYPVPSAKKLIAVPPTPSGNDFYVMVSTSQIRSYYATLAKLCYELAAKNNMADSSNINDPLLSKQSIKLLSLCSKFWRVDYPSQAVLLYAGGHLSGLLKDKLYIETNLNELGSIDIENTKTILHSLRILLEEGKLDWNHKDYWSLKDQEEWVQNLMISYNESLFSIKESLQMIFSATVKPKFGPYLSFLGEYLESDSLFPKLLQIGLVKKWEKKLSKSLLKTAEKRYAELLSNLPRDDTLSIIHILDISDKIISDIKSLQKRYKNPLLGFLNVSRTVAAVLTAMFAADSKNILKHIEAYAKNKNQFLPYGDALEAYKSISEIRGIYIQVSSPESNFRFDLESFFYPYLKSWMSEADTKVLQIIKQAIKFDTYEPINVEEDEKKFSSSILDIFTLMKEYLKILNNLKWGNQFQLAKIKTLLLKSISDGAIYYATTITDKIIKELEGEEEGKTLQEMEIRKAENRKSGSWFNEVKNVVNNIQSYNKSDLEEPYNFKPATCVALNNIAAMMDQLSNLEDLLDPESISGIVASQEPSSQHEYTSHVFSLRLVRAENLKSTNSSTSVSNIHSYVTLMDTKARRTICKTRTINNTNNPEWDEEFEFNLPARTSLTVSATVWDERIGTHSICGRALLQLDPRRFKHDGIPQEIYLDLDSQGRLLLEIAVESERLDAIFVMGRAHRTLKRCQERCVKLIVEKFSRFIHHCFSRSNLKSICGNNGMQKPTAEQVDNAMMPLYNYLNMNLQVLSEYLTKDLLMKVMVFAWSVIIASADVLIIPKLTSAKTIHLSTVSSKFTQYNAISNSTWKSAVSSAVANVTNSIGISGFGRQLTNIELETVFSWLNFLCFDFFHNEGNGPPVKDLKSEQYQALLLIPVYYDSDVQILKQEVERLSPAFIKTLRDKNNFDYEDFTSKDSESTSVSSIGRAGSLARNKTISANATVKARAKAAKEAQEARSDPIAAQTLAEDIILRLLILKDESSYVIKRLEQRERLAHSISTERLARAAAEGKFSGI